MLFAPGGNGQRLFDDANRAVGSGIKWAGLIARLMAAATAAIDVVGYWMHSWRRGRVLRAIVRAWILISIVLAPGGTASRAAGDAAVAFGQQRPGLAPAAGLALGAAAVLGAAAALVRPQNAAAQVAGGSLAQGLGSGQTIVPGACLVFGTYTPIFTFPPGASGQATLEATVSGVVPGCFGGSPIEAIGLMCPSDNPLTTPNQNGNVGNGTQNFTWSIPNCGTSGAQFFGLAHRTVPDVTVTWTVVLQQTPSLNSLGTLPTSDASAQFRYDTSDPVDTFNGSYAYQRTDVAERGRGPVPSFVRAYNSIDTRFTSLGPGWTHNYAARLYNPGDASHPNDVVVERPNGRSDRYQYNASTGSYAPPPAVSAQLVNTGGTYTLTEADQSSWSFDAAGKLTKVSDRYGNQSQLTYDANLNLSQISDPAGRNSLTLTYSQQAPANCPTPLFWELTAVQDFLGHGVQYAYDCFGRLQTVTDRNGKATTYTYDGTSQRLVSVTDANGHVAVTNHYDTNGRVDWQEDARGLTTGQQTTINPYNASVSCPATVTGPCTATTVTNPANSFDGNMMTVVATYDGQNRLVQRVTTPSSVGGESFTESYGYAANGFRSSATDGRGNTTSFCYDVDYAGNPVATSLGNLTRVIAPAPSGGNPLVTLIKYDTRNNVVESISPKGITNSGAVTCATNLSGAVNSSGLYVTDLAYDTTFGAELLSVTRKYTDPETQAIQTAITKFEYGDSSNPGLVTRTIPPRGNTGGSPDYNYATTLGYFGSGSEAGLLQSVTDPLGNKTTYTYDAGGRRLSLVDPLGNASGASPTDHTWSFVYDNEDRLTQASAPAPSPGGATLATAAQFDAVGNRLSVTDANGQITRYQYDVRDSLSEVDQSATQADPNGDAKIVTSYQYDNLGNLARVDRAAGNSTYESVADYAYDGLNRVRKETQYPQAGWPSTPNGSTASQTLITQTSYDLDSNRQTLVDPLGQTTTFANDAVNRLTGITYSDGATPNVSYGYDANGNRSTMGDGSGPTTYSYDELDRLVSVSSPGPQTIGYRYDLDGNRTKLIYPDGTAVSYTFDKASRLQSLLDWASHSTGYTYFADGLLDTINNANTTTAQFSYDDARRLTQVSNQLGTSIISQHTYTLDVAGNRTALNETLAQVGSGGPVQQSLSYGYDKLYRLTSASGGGVAGGGMAPASRLSAPAAATGAGAPLAPELPAAPNAKSTPTPTPTRTATRTSTPTITPTPTNTLPPTSTPTPTPTNTSTPTATATGTSTPVPTSTPTATGTATPTPSNTATATSTPSPTSTATVTSTATSTSTNVPTATPTATNVTTYTYDPLGNRLTKTLNGTLTSYGYDRADRITAAGSTTYSVNANGNETARGPDTLSYDQANRLTSAIVGGVTSTYVYDGDGRRISKTVGGVTTTYVYDVGGSLPIVLDDGSRKYVWGAGGLAYSVDKTTAATQVYHTDGVGSVRALTDNTGGVVQTYQTDEFGGPAVIQGSSTQPFGYTGEQRDPEDGLIYLRARMYDATIGRFLQADSARKSGPGGEGWNRYSYVGNNPAVFTDSTGRCSSQVCGQQIAAFGEAVRVGAIEGENSGGGAPLSAAGAMAAAEVEAEFAVEEGLIAEGAITWNPINGPGPLGEQVASTFRSSTYTQEVLQQDMTLYRAYGGRASALGKYWTDTPPSGPLQSQLDLALNPAWGNTAESVTTIRVPAGTEVFVGYAAPQELAGGSSLLGGGRQIYTPNINPEWVVP